MPRNASEKHERMSLRIISDDKALLMQAAELEHTSLTEFVTHASLNYAREIIEKHERLQLDERDSLKVIELLESPPEPNEKLIQAALSMYKHKHKHK